MHATGNIKLSIITVNLNNCDGLRRTIDSVVSQTFTDFEWIVIDGGSTDCSRELMEQYKDHFAFWCSEPDNGIYNAMNKGIVHANGEWLLFLNSGDWLAEKKVYFSGSSTEGISPSFMGSVITPLMAAATAVSGDTRYTLPSLVPDLPSKFLLNVLKDTPPEFGEKPIPMQGPQAHSRTLAPDAMISDRAPQSASMARTCLDPGEIERLTLGSMVFPLRRAATLSMS